MWIFALSLNILHLAYHQITTQIDFYPFNNIRHYTLKERLLEVSINGLFMIFPVVALLLDNSVMIQISCWILGSIIIGEFLSWWRHYFFGPTQSWQETYDRIFKDTIKVLPPIKDNPIPNLEHCILHSITILSFLTTLMYYLNK
jgi:hypothetical protein